jgi:hypothetical protein
MPLIDMKCPACSAGGRVPKEKIGTRLVCKKCLTVFHLTPSGQAVLGEPPPTKVTHREKVSKEPTGYEAGDALEEMAAKLAKVKLPPPRTIAIVAGIALVVGLVAWFFSRQSLETRARTVAVAISTGESNSTAMKKIIDISVPGTETDVILWYADIYRQFLDLKLALGMDPKIKVEIPGNSGGGSGVAIIKFSREGATGTAPSPIETMQPIPSLANAKDSLELRLYFAVDAFGNWLLDGKKTSGKG